MLQGGTVQIVFTFQTIGEQKNNEAFYNFISMGVIWQTVTFIIQWNR